MEESESVFGVPPLLSLPEVNWKYEEEVPKLIKLGRKGAQQEYSNKLGGRMVGTLASSERHKNTADYDE